MDSVDDNITENKNIFSMTDQERNDYNQNKLKQIVSKIKTKIVDTDCEKLLTLYEKQYAKCSNSPNTDILRDLFYSCIKEGGKNSDKLKDLPKLINSCDVNTESNDTYTSYPKEELTKSLCSAWYDEFNKIYKSQKVKVSTGALFSQGLMVPKYMLRFINDEMSKKIKKKSEKIQYFNDDSEVQDREILSSIPIFKSLQQCSMSKGTPVRVSGRKMNYLKAIISESNKNILLAKYVKTRMDGGHVYRQDFKLLKYLRMKGYQKCCERKKTYPNFGTYPDICPDINKDLLYDDDMLKKREEQEKKDEEYNIMLNKIFHYKRDPYLMKQTQFKGKDHWTKLVDKERYKKGGRSRQEYLDLKKLNEQEYAKCSNKQKEKNHSDTVYDYCKKLENEIDDGLRSGTIKEYDNAYDKYTIYNNICMDTRKYLNLQSGLTEKGTSQGIIQYFSGSLLNKSDINKLQAPFRKYSVSYTHLTLPTTPYV